MSKFAVQWKLPVADWATAPYGSVSAVELAEIDPMTRRRLSSLSKATLAVAERCMQACGSARLVFSSQHGELGRTTQILEAIATQEPVSPTAFSLSVLNAMTGVSGIARNDRSAATAISSGAQSLGYALLEAYMQYRLDPGSPVVVVYGDERVPPIYGLNETGADAHEAIALVIQANASSCLECTMNAPGTRTEGKRFASHALAVRHTLTTHEPASWSAVDTRDTADASITHVWHWRWLDGSQ